MNLRSTLKSTSPVFFLRHKLAVSAAFLAVLMLLSLYASLRKVEAQDAEVPSQGVVRNGGLELEVKAGYGKINISSFAGSWVPFRITLSNRGEPVAGRLVVRTESPPSPNSQVREYVKDVQLPTGAHQLHEIAAYINSNHKEPEIFLIVDGAEVIKATVGVGRISWGSDELQMGVVDGDQTALNNISSVEIERPQNRALFKASIKQKNGSDPDSQPAQQSTATPQANQPAQPPTAPSRQNNNFGQNQRGPKVQPLVLPPEDLPSDYVSYDQLDLLVLGDAPLGQLSESQVQAIKNWLASGGFLIVTGGADFAGMRASGLDSILPVDIYGSVTSDSLNELSDTYGRFESSDSPLLMSAKSKSGSRVLLGSPDKVIVGERDYGSGVVRFLAINPKLNPYRGWGAAKDLWNDLLVPVAESMPGQRNWFGRGGRGGRNASGIQDFLFNLAEIKPPSANYFIFFLLTYVLMVGPINYLVLRWMKKLDWAWITIPAVVILFTVTSVVVAEIRRGGRSIATDISLVEVHQPDQLVRTINWMMIMPSFKGVQEVAINSQNTFLTDMNDGFGTRATTSGSIEIKRDPKGSSMSVPMNPWASGLFKLRSVEEASSLLVKANEPESAHVVVKNLGSKPITNAVYLSAAGISDPFDLAQGEEKQITLNTPQALRFSDWYSGKLNQGGHEQQLFDDLAFTLDREIGGQEVFRNGFFANAVMTNTLSQLEKPLLVGFVEENPIQMNFSGTINRRSKSFYVVHL